MGIANLSFVVVVDLISDQFRDIFYLLGGYAHTLVESRSSYECFILYFIIGCLKCEVDDIFEGFALRKDEDYTCSRALPQGRFIRVEFSVFLFSLWLIVFDFITIIFGTFNYEVC